MLFSSRFKNLDRKGGWPHLLSILSVFGALSSNPAFGFFVGTSKVYSLQDPTPLLFTIENSLTSSSSTPGTLSAPQGTRSEPIRIQSRTYFAVPSAAKPDQDLNLPVLRDRVFIKGEQVTRIETELPVVGESGFAEVRGKSLFVSYTSGGKTKTEELPIEENLLLGDRIIDFILEHFSELKGGARLKIRILVLDRFDTFGFELQLKEASEQEVQIQLKPTSILISAFVSPVIFTYQLRVGKPPSLRRVVGNIKPKIWNGRNWVMTSGTTVFPESD
jgi:hypothetical protein